MDQESSPQESSPRQTRSFLLKRFEEVGIRPKTKFGQNFLIDLNLLELLYASSEASSNDVVLEVGTGTGSLTAMLASQAAHVVSVEIDDQLYQLAKESLEGKENVTLLFQDALKNKNKMNPVVMETLQKHLNAAPDRQLKLAANLPYNVATPIVSNLLELEQPPVRMTITIQKELADRMSASPRSKDYSSLSIWVQSQCEVEIVRIMAPTVFWPRPKVHSAIVNLYFKPELRARISDIHKFHQFVRALFFHRRKFLRSELLSAYKGILNKAQVDEVRDQLELGPTARAEELPVEAIIDLFHAMEAKVAEVRSQEMQ